MGGALGVDEVPVHLRTQIEKFERRKTVLLVHGMCSCTLETEISDSAGLGPAPEGYHPAWVNAGRFISSREQTLKSLSLKMENGKVVPVNDGVKVRAKPGVEGIHCLNEDSHLPSIPIFRTALDKFGPHFNLMPLNYDWRRWGDIEYAKEVLVDFRAAILASKQVTGRPVDIVGHSMGALVVLWCLNEMGARWVKANVGTLVLVCPAPSGTPVMFPCYAAGPLQGFVNHHIHIPKALEKDVSQASSSWPCLISEFPQECGGIQTWDLDFPFVITPTKKYCVGDVTKFLEDVEALAPERNMGPQLIKGVYQMNSICKAPPVTTHIIYNDGLDTVKQMKYKDEDITVWPEDITFGPGDGTVLAAQLEKLAEEWRKQKRDDASVILHKLPGQVVHAQMIQSPEACDVILKLLPDQPIDGGIYRAWKMTTPTSKLSNCDASEAELRRRTTSDMSTGQQVAAPVEPSRSWWRRGVTGQTFVSDTLADGEGCAAQAEGPVAAAAEATGTRSWFSRRRGMPVTPEQDEDVGVADAAEAPAQAAVLEKSSWWSSR